MACFRGSASEYFVRRSCIVRMYVFGFQWILSTEPEHVHSHL